MNELESYYNQSSNMGQTLGMIQRGEVAQRQGALNVQEAKDSIAGDLLSEKEKDEEEGGGIGMGAGLLTKEGLAVAGKRVIKTATEKARTLIQSKVDELSQAKTAGTLGEIEGTGENLAQNALANASNLTNAPVINPPVSGGGGAGGGGAGGGGSSATGSAQPQLGSGNANLSDNIDDDLVTNDDIANTLAGGVDRGATGFVSKVKNFFKGNPAENAVNTQVENAGAISAKTMSDLGDKIGVDFGDLSKSDIGEALGNTLGKGALDAEKITSGLGYAGDIMEALGPLGLIAGLGASIAGIFEAKKVNENLIQKQNDINTMTDNINGMGGMSFGSISNSAIDTSQFRSGGSAMNF